MSGYVYLCNMAKKDLNQLAKFITEQATSEDKDLPQQQKNEAAVALGRLGGLKGGKARAEKLTTEYKSAIAKKAAIARWSKNKPNQL